MKRFFLLLLSFLILITSIHFNLSAHYCGRQLVDISLFGKAESCAMGEMTTCDSEKKPCCSDREIIIEGEDYLNHKDFSKTKLKRVDNFILQLYYFTSLRVEKKVAAKVPNLYSPPLIERATPVLFQSFLL
jgi:hypothetical protein